MNKQIKRPLPVRPDDEDDFKVKRDWLLKMYAYSPKPLDMVVDMYEPSANCVLKREAFEFTFYGWSVPRIGASGRPLVKPLLATDFWRNHKLIIEGVRMRPDRPFPLYEEDGKKFKNIYCAPEHTGEGDIAPFHAFMQRFLPNEREREWLLDHLAHKQARPEIPGTAVLFVADTDDGVREGKFGTGRGMFFKVMHKLYGEEYSRAEDFDILDGSSGQAAYTDWRHNSVLITIDEAKSSPTSYRRGERSAIFEVLKNVIDPAPKRCRFKSKYGMPFDGMSYASFMVACNHADAIAIPANDRRFTVLLNGREMTVEEEKAFAAWMANPGNIAELSRFLAARDLSAFNMFRPIDTTGKRDMAELSLSQVEGILRDLMADDAQELVFTRYQLETQVADILGGGSRYNSIGTGQWRGEFESSWKAYCVLLKTKNGSPSRVRVNKQPVKLYCFRSRKRQVEKSPEAAWHASARKRGGVDEPKKPEDVKRGEKEAMTEAEVYEFFTGKAKGGRGKKGGIREAARKAGVPKSTAHRHKPPG